MVKGDPFTVSNFSNISILRITCSCLLKLLFFCLQRSFYSTNTMSYSILIAKQYLQFKSNYYAFIINLAYFTF